MRYLLPAAMIFGALSLSAQPWPRQGPPRGRYEDHDPRGGSGVVGRVQSDLRRAASNGYFNGHERSHFERAMRELDKFESNWGRGRFDNHSLDKAIENIDHLANASQVHPRDRESLREDLWALRDFRSRGGYSGYRDRRQRW